MPNTNSKIGAPTSRSAPRRTAQVERGPRGIGKTAPHLPPVAHREGVQAGVDGVVAAKANDGWVDGPLRLILQEMHEVVAPLGLRQPRLVRDGGKQDGISAPSTTCSNEQTTPSPAPLRKS